MKPILTICIYVFLSTLQSLLAQQFVDPANSWYIDDVCYDFSNGNIDSYAWEYSFSEELVEIGGQAYRKLITDNAAPITAFGIGEYYRESNGQVFIKRDESSAEYLIYDFNAALGEEFTIGEGSEHPLVLKVLAIDTVALGNGESRKRIELGLASNLEIKALWVEGIGSHSAPMNTLDMFMLDCWVELNCFRVDGAVEYQIGACVLGPATSAHNMEERDEISIFPNPAKDRILIKTNAVVSGINIIDARGKPVRVIKGPGISEIWVGDLPPGLYFVEMRDAAGRVMWVNRFVKE